MLSTLKSWRRPHTYQNRLARALKHIGLGLLLVLVSVPVLDVFYTRADAPTRVYAAAPANLNFQARLLSGTGAIVADGTYSVEFKLYSASSGGTAAWTETQNVQVRAGYLSVYLGDVTPFSGIDWSQQQWLTMNVNGDGEMNPRLRLTSVPSAFRADQADALKNGSGTLTAGGIAQLAPSSIQAVNSALAALRINQTGSGFLAQMQGNGVDVFTVDKAGNGYLKGDLDVDGGLIVGNNTGTTAGTIRWNGSDFEGYDGSQWRSFTQGSGSNANASASFVSGLANVAANATGVAVETLLFTTATAVSNTAGVTGFTAPADGSFRTCLIKNTANITGGSLNLRWRVNGVSVGSGACTMNTTNNRQSSAVIDPGVVTFNAGDTIGIAFDTVGLAPTTNDFTVYWTVEYNSSAGGGGGASTLQDAYDLSAAPAIISTADNKDIRFSLTDTTTDSNFLINILTGSTGRFAVQDNGTDALSVTSSAITLAKPVTASAGLNLSSSGITNAGSITGVGTNITAAAGLAIASGGSGDLTLSSASGLLVVGASTLRTADSLNLDLSKATDTALTLSNSGAGISNLNLADGGLQTAGTLRLTNGGALQNITGLTITSGGAAITGDIALGGSSSDRLTINSQILGANALVFQGATDNGFATTLSVTDPTANNTIALPNASGTLVLDSRSVIAGTGLSGGGNLSADRTLSLDINGLGAITTANNTDYIPVYDSVSSSVKKVSRSDFLQGLTGALQYKGTWDASTNTPSLSDVTGVAGYTYAVSVAGTRDLGSGSIAFALGDFVIHDGTKWQRAPSGSTVASVFGRTGAVTAQSGDYSALQITNTPAGSIAANTVQGALNELDSEKLGSLNGLTGNSQTFANDTNITITSSGSTHTLGWSGQLSVSRGGTGASSFTSNGILYGNNTGALQVTAAGTGGQLLIANSSGVPGFVSVTGDATLSDTGVLTIAGDAVALGTNTTGDYVQSLGTLTGLSTSGNSGEGSTPGLSVLYGSTANTAVQGNTTITVTPGTNLSGGGSITLGAGGSVTLNVSSSPSFATGVTSPVFTSNAALSISSTGAGNDITLNSADKIILTGFDCSTNDNGGVLTVNSAGELLCDNDDGGTAGSVTGSGTAGRITFYSGTSSLGDSWLLQDVSTLRLDSGRDFDLVSGNLSIGGTTVLGSDLTLQNLTGLTVVSGGANITGNSTITGTLTGLTGLTVASGGFNVTGNSTLTGTLTGLTGLTVASGGASITGNSTVTGTFITYNSGYNAFASSTSLNSYGYFRSVDGGDSSSRFELGAYDINGASQGGRDLVLNPLGGNVAVGATSTAGLFSVGASNQFQVSSTGVITAPTSTNTINGLIINAGSLSGVTGLTFTSGSLNLANGGITNTGSLAGVTTISASGAITAATTTNTINGLVINAGALSGVTGLTFTSGGLDLNGGGITNAGTIAGVTGLTITSGGFNVTGNSTLTGTLTGLTGLTVASGGANITGNSTITGTLSGLTGLTVASGGASITGNSTITGTLTGLTGLTVASGGFNVTGNSTLTGTLTGLTGLTVASGGASISGGAGLLVQQTGTGAAVIIDRTDGVIGSLKSGSAKVAFFFDEAGSFAISKDSRTNIAAGTGAGVDLLNITAAGAVTLAGSLSGVTTLTTTGAITAPTTTNTINGLIINAGALSGVTTLNLTGAITGATATNTINGLIINSGALSGITGYSQTSGNFGISGTGTFGTGTGLTSINGAMTTTGLATFNGGVTLQTGDSLTVNGDAFTDLTGNGLQITTGALNILAQTGGGLSTSASGLTMLRTCSNGQLLKWNGTAWACAADNTGISDVRLKENIVSVDDSILDRIKDIRVVNFNFKCHDETLSDLALACDDQTGVIAQELAQVFPGLVRMNSQGYNEVNFGALNFYTLKATTELAKIVSSSGNITANNISTGGVLRLGADGVLQNLNGLNLTSGGASIAGGLNNNFGGIANVGSLSGVSTLNMTAQAEGNLLTLTKDNKGVFTVFNNGALQLQLDSENAFAVKDSVGNSILNVDSANGKISLGGAGKTVLLTFGIKDTAGDPTGINGSEYYNAAMGKFRCFQNNRWQDCLPVTNASYVLGDRVSAWAQPLSETEIPGEYRTWIDLTNAREFRLIMRVTSAGSQGANCRLQYANGDNGPWATLGDSNAKLKVDQTGTLKADWAKIEDAANKEVLVRVVCSGDSNGNPSPELSFSNISVQLR